MLARGRAGVARAKTQNLCDAFAVYLVEIAFIGRKPFELSTVDRPSAIVYLTATYRTEARRDLRYTGFRQSPELPL